MLLDSILILGVAFVTTKVFLAFNSRLSEDQTGSLFEGPPRISPYRGPNTELGITSPTLNSEGFLSIPNSVGSSPFVQFRVNDFIPLPDKVKVEPVFSSLPSYEQFDFDCVFKYLRIERYDDTVLGGLAQKYQVYEKSRLYGMFENYLSGLFDEADPLLKGFVDQLIINIVALGLQLDNPDVLGLTARLAGTGLPSIGEIYSCNPSTVSGALYSTVLQYFTLNNVEVNVIPVGVTESVENFSLYKTLPFDYYRVAYSPSLNTFWACQIQHYLNVGYNLELSLDPMLIYVKLLNLDEFHFIHGLIDKLPFGSYGQGATFSQT